jgi:hypothetical protein
MKFTLALATFVVAVYGQTINDIPPCAVPCIQDAITSATTCSATDFACACQTANFNAIQAASINCVVAACGADVAISTHIFSLFKGRETQVSVLILTFSAYRQGSPRRSGSLRRSRLKRWQISRMKLESWNT